MKRGDFKMIFDGMHGISGPYAIEILHKELGVDMQNLLNCDVLEDFGGLHPDPNLTYAKDLGDKLDVFCDINNEQIIDSLADFGAACDGDADRNMILGKQFFVTPSDSLAVMLAHWTAFLPYKPIGVARSMPTSAALD